MEVEVPALSSDAKDRYSESVSALLVEDEDDNDGDCLAPCITLPSIPKMPRLEYGSFLKWTQTRHYGTWRIAQFVRLMSTIP
jgi:hypothetical protein